MRRERSWRLAAGLIAVLCLVAAGLIAGNAFAAPPTPIPQFLSLDGYQNMPSSGEKQHMRLVGYNDLQGRETLQVSTKGDWVYVGHHNRPSSYPDLHYNPLTQEYEENGTTILDISNPARPRIVAHIPNFENRNSRSATVVYNFLGSGKDFLVRNSEGATAPRWKYEVFDITNRAQGIIGIFKIGEITGTPVGSCSGSPCGGIVSSTAHKAYFSQSGKLYVALDEPGFRNGLHLAVYDMSTLPAAPKAPTIFSAGTNFDNRFIGRAWLPGQKLTEPEPEERLSGHHPIVDEANHRVCMGYLTGGNVVCWDIGTNSGAPDFEYPIEWTLDLNPPGKEAHTVTMIKYDKVPNFGYASGNAASEIGLPRLYAMVSDEAVSDSYWRFNDTPPGVRSGVREKITMIDVTHYEENKTGMAVSSWQVPPENYIMRGGRFGPHQFNETINAGFNTFDDKIAFVAYFNAGVRAIDITDPYKMKEIGYYVPQENPRCGYIGGNQPHPNIQSNDVDVDYRGLVYAPDRVGCGLWILELQK